MQHDELAALETELATADDMTDPVGRAERKLKYGMALHQVGSDSLKETRKQYEDVLTVFTQSDYPTQWFKASVLLLQLLASELHSSRTAADSEDSDFLQAVSIADELSDFPGASYFRGAACGEKMVPYIADLRANVLASQAVSDPGCVEAACAAQRAAVVAADPRSLIAANASLELAALLISHDGDRSEAIAALERALAVYRPDQQPTGWFQAHVWLHDLLVVRAKTCADILAACQHLEDAAMVKPPLVGAKIYARACQRAAALLTDDRCPDDPYRRDRALVWGEECLTYLPEEDVDQRMDEAYVLGRGYFRRFEEWREAADLERAVMLLDEAAAMAREAGAPATRIIRYCHDAAIARRSFKTDEGGSLELTIEEITRLLEAYDGDITVADRATLHHSLGDAYEKRFAGDAADNKERAIGFLEAAMAAYDRATQPDEWASAAHGLSISYVGRIKGDHGENLERGIALAKAAAEIRTREKNPQLWARTMHNLGRAYAQRPLGNEEENLERAIWYSRAALEVETKDIMPDQWAGALRNLGNAYYARVKGIRKENLEIAATCFRDALQVAEQSGLRTYGETLMGLANVLGSLGQLTENGEGLAEAVAAYEKAASVFAELDLPEKRSYVLFNLAGLLSTFQSDSPDSALAALHQCLEIWNTQSNPIQAARAYWQLALLTDRAGRTAEAYGWICKAVEADEMLYAGATSEDSKSWLASNSADWYLEAVDLALRSGAPAHAALLLAERGRARMLREAVVAQQPNWNLPRELIAREADLLHRRRKKWTALADAGQGIDETEREFTNAKETTRELTEIWEQLASYPGGDEYVATRKGAVSWERLLDWVNRQPVGFALLEYVVIRSAPSRRIVAFVVRQDRPDPIVVEIPISLPELGRCIMTFYSEIHESTAGPVGKDTWDRTALPLVTTVMPKLAGVRLLCIVPHVMVHHLPLHALGAAGETLLDKMVVYYCPSATLAMRLEQRTPRGAVTGGRHTVVVGDSVGDLPHARLEAERVGRVLGVSPLVGRQATLDSVRKLLPAAKLAHFACHGYLRGEDAAHSAIILADGLLTADQLQMLSLNCDLLVLSGCDTGFQPLQQTLDVGGLMSALIAAGTKRAIGGLWPVDDKATAALFTAFYQKLTSDWTGTAADEIERSVAGCLRSAALKLRDIRPQRYFWAPFIVVGSW